VVGVVIVVVEWWMVACRMQDGCRMQDAGLMEGSCQMLTVAWDRQGIAMYVHNVCMYVCMYVHAPRQYRGTHIGMYMYIEWNGHMEWTRTTTCGTQVEDMSQQVGQPSHSGNGEDKGVLTKGER
jgi:hypothetical protein